LDDQNVIRKCTNFLFKFSNRDLLWLDAFVGQFLAKDVEINFGPDIAAVIEDAQDGLTEQGEDYQLNEGEIFCRLP
jgi:hypothetical protein